MSPYKPRVPCPGRGPRRGGCPNLVHSGTICPECMPYEKAKIRRYDKKRDESPGRKFLHSTTWRRIAKAKLDRDALCERCSTYMHPVEAFLAHHRDHNELNNRPENHESLCTPCHEAEHKGERWGR